MKIPRSIENQIISRIETTGKAIVIYGPRQSGKTTLANDIIGKLNKKTLMVNGDDLRYSDVLSSRDSTRLHELVSDYDVIFIDEAQRIRDIGINLKIIIDNHPDLAVIATGSSSFELANTINEPLTGRKWTFQLFPISVLELGSIFNPFELRESLEQRLIWGSYPYIFNIEGQEIRSQYLRELTSDYLYKDILVLDKIRDSWKIRNLLKLLAFQIGSEVSHNELGTQLGMSKDTVSRYIDLLVKSFVLMPLAGYSKNPRKEISKTRKYYFFDLGVRNALIDNFKGLADRDDIGKLWENFIVVERLKRNTYLQQPSSLYFWRTYTGMEVDLVEESGESLSGYEIKWNKSNVKPPAAWHHTYSDASWKLITADNYLDFIT